MQLHQQFLIQQHWSQHIKNSDSLCSSPPVTCLQMARTVFSRIEIVHPSWAVHVRNEMDIIQHYLQNAENHNDIFQQCHMINLPTRQIFWESHVVLGGLVILILFVPLRLVPCET